jgi:hypothetical protein
MRAEMIRAVVLALLFAPAFAGCIVTDDAGTVVEAFVAQYLVAAKDRLPQRSITVTLHGPETYLAADGSRRQGNVVDVDEGEATKLISHPQAILASDLSPVRVRWCNGWSGEPSVCTHDQYDWDVAMGGGPLRVPYGIAANVATPPAATRQIVSGVLTVKMVDNRTYEFADDRLAPTRVLGWPGAGQAVYAIRTSYRSTGPLVPSGSPEAASKLAPVAGALLPGADEDLAGDGFTLAGAVEYLRSQRPEADRLLRDGACLASFHAARWERRGSSQTGVPLWDNPETTLSLTLANAKGGENFVVEWGTKAVTGARSFLSAGDKGAATEPLDCATRSEKALPVGLSFSMAKSIRPDTPLWRYRVDWAERPGGRWLSQNLGFEGGEVSMDGSLGRIVSLYVPMGSEVDGLQGR